MFNKLSISTKIIILVLLLVTLAVVSESIVSYQRNKETIKQNYIAKLELIASTYIDNVDNSFQNIENSLNFIKQDSYLISVYKNLVYLAENPSDSTDRYALTYRKGLNDEIIDRFNTSLNLEDLYLINDKGIVIYQNSKLDQANFKFHNIDNDLIDIHKSKFHINKPILEKNNFYIYFTMPISEKENNQIGMIVGKIDANLFFDQVKPNIYTLGKTTELLIYKSHKNQIHSLGNSSMPKKMDYRSDSKNPIYLSAKGVDGEGLFTDFFKKETVATWRYIKKHDIAVMAKINRAEAYYDLGNFNLITITVGVLIILISIALTMMFSKVITLPMIKLKRVLGLISNGVLPKELKTTLKDESGEMINLVNKLVKSLKRTAEFAYRIGEGDFKSDFKPASKKDILGQALINMRESLQSADRKDHLRNRIVSGVADIGEILRRTDTISSMGEEVLEYLCHRINAVQGAFYTTETVGNKKRLSIRASYAYHKKKHLSGTFEFGKGLIGQAAIEKDMIIRTEIPDDYTFITSGILGDKKPKCLVIAPLINEEEVMGVIEVIGFDKFNDGDILFIKEISEIIARTIFNTRVNENTKKLLEESQRMSSELQVQQEELRQNALEMEQTQKELQTTNTKLQEQIKEVNNAQKRIKALLENASEVITIYDERGIVKYISPSVHAIFGYQEEDIVGISDMKFIHDEDQAVFKNMLQDLLELKKDIITIEISYFKKTGEKIRIEATGKNMLNDPAIKGIVVNSRNITERKRAEEEERKRGQMQALSENSLDLIMRLDNKGYFYYINPIIKTLSGENTDYFLNNTLDKVTIDKSFKKQLTDIIDSVFTSAKNISTEIDFKTNDGKDLIMLLNAIPEFKPDSIEVETALIVAHDITDQKAIENEIKSKNEKINDSINYAENIQEAILPDTVIVRQTLPESFIFFKPRDVVSGDFPWFRKIGNDIYIAAVDCTGHGVPGALISLVGYFLLNGILEREKTVLSPSVILDQLDLLVTTTFRQNQSDSKIKDGMDIAMCKINLENNTLEYAGANRPLYIVNNQGDFNEIKADKFPIGGGSSYGYKGHFTNHKIKLNKGDTVYIFSDGLPDQFGGENYNQKFGPNRVRQIITENYQNPIDKISVEVEKQFYSWMQDTKQTDDVLLIGIRI